MADWNDITDFEIREALFVAQQSALMLAMCAATLVEAPAASLTRPLDAGERLPALDILRGFALFGMILVHFHQKMRLPATGVEDLIGWGVWVLVEQKAWGTFAFLFGAGFAILLRRLEARGAPVVSICLRRLAALAIFGIIAEVGFGFHILFEYASWGAAMLVVRRWSTRALLLTAALSACARPLSAEVTAVYAWLSSVATAPSTTATLAAAVDAASQQSSYLALLSARWALFLGSFPHTWQNLLPDANFSLFAIGLLAVRHEVFDEPRRHARLIIGWMIFGFVAWAASWLVLNRLPRMPIPGTDWPMASGFGLLQDQWLCLTYIGAVVLLLALYPVWTERLAMFGEAGRMALTNYMVQAAALDALASGYGASLRLRPYVYVLAASVLFGAEAFASRAWLSTYQFGPFEWIWRIVTYARVQPLRRAVAESAPVG